jgi:glycosyltransferase involved in cell wall biosynthesis
MEKILFIAYQFPPRGGPGVHRSLNFVKYLRDSGFDPIVLTVDENDIRKSGYTTDETLLSAIPNDIKIIRTPSYEPVKLVRFLMKLHIYRIAWFFFYPLLWEWSTRWSKKNIPVAEKIIRENNIRLVYTSSGPFSVLSLGKKLKEQANVKWIADLRDPFTDAYAWDFPSKFHWKARRKFEKNTLPFADKLILNTPETRKLFLERKLTTPEKSTCITNGF